MTALAILDGLLGWLLALPRDAAIVALALGTSLAMAAVRRLVTDQPLLARCARDLRRLKERSRAAKRDRDRDGVRRIQSTMATVRLMQLAAEGRVLAVAIVPLALLGWWGLERLEHLPLRIGDRFTLTVHYARPAVGRLTHLVPDPALALHSRPVQLVRTDESDLSRGIAQWDLSADSPVETSLLVRCQGATFEHPVSVGTRFPGPADCVADAGPIESSHLNLRPALLLGRIPGIPALGLAPWLFGYLTLTLLLLPITRRIVRVS